MKMSMAKKINGLVLLTALVIGISSLLSAYLIIKIDYNEISNEEMAVTANAIQNQLDMLKTRVRSAAVFAAANQNIAAAVEKGDASALRGYGKTLMEQAGIGATTFVNVKGMVIARTHADKTGDSVLNQSVVKSALSGTPVVGIDEGSVVALSVRAAQPVIRNGSVVGCVVVVEDISGNHAFVDNVKKTFGVECTIFKNDTRVSTTIVKDGQRATGTKMDNPAVIASVLEKGQRFQKVNKILNKEYNTLYWPLKNAEGKIIGMGFIGKSVAAINGMIYKIIAVVCAATMVAYLVMLLLGWRLTKTITDPINKCIVTADCVADGDLSRQIEISADNEAGKLLGSLKRMNESLKTMISETVGVSSDIASASSQLQGIADQIATGAEEVASQIAMVATASEEMSSTSSDIARNCAMAAERSGQSRESAKNGAAIVQETITGMTKIAEQVKMTAITVESLGSRSEQIGQIIGTIEDIADQTNLLALNAAIEAARAGEQGRGFAVVADEVRALAERTTKATREIGEMIKGIQSETKTAVRAMEEGVTEVERGAEASQRSGEALRAILSEIDEVSMQINQIATAAEEQTMTTNEISTSIHQVTDVVQQTARGAEETSSSAGQLSVEARRLQDLIGRFRI